MRYFELKNRRYLGSKRLVLPNILAVCAGLSYTPKSVVDIFAGTGLVGQGFLRNGMKVTFNDLLHSNAAIHNAFFGSETVNLCELEEVIASVNAIDSATGLSENYFSHTFGGAYFSEVNARLIGHLREIAEEFSGRSKDILIASAIYGADKVANTVGHYDAFRPGAEDTPRVVFGMPKIESFSGSAEIISDDANALAKRGQWDVAYLDPPYNSRQYGDMYHVLENLTDWQKPEVHFKARKMDRRHIRSAFSTQSAPLALGDLVQSLDVRTIVLSYNDTGARGNSRSAAKISDDEIFEILSRKGKVEIQEVDHRPFTTGKSRIGGVSERLFVCHVGRSTAERTANSHKEETPVFVKSPLNYVGNKKALMPQLRPIFEAAPKSPQRFMDIFCGGMTVGLNCGVERVSFNDRNEDVINLGRVFRDWDYANLTAEIEELVSRFGLSDSRRYGYEAYGANSSNGLGQFNKTQYYKLREHLDLQPRGTDERAIAFFTAIVFSFNNQIRFNGLGKFNMPVGKRDFNARVRANLQSTMQRLHDMDPDFTSRDFREVLADVQMGDLVYCDPPYLLGLAPYNEKNGWSIKDEVDLLEGLSRLSARGIPFVLSNVSENKGLEHVLLLEWVAQESFTLRKLEKSYANSSYQRKESGPSIEVAVTNF